MDVGHVGGGEARRTCGLSGETAPVTLKRRTACATAVLGAQCGSLTATVTSLSPCCCCSCGGSSTTARRWPPLEPTPKNPSAGGLRPPPHATTASREGANRSDAGVIRQYTAQRPTRASPPPPSASNSALISASCKLSRRLHAQCESNRASEAPCLERSRCYCPAVLSATLLALAGCSTFRLRDEGPSGVTKGRGVCE